MIRLVASATNSVRLAAATGWLLDQAAAGEVLVVAPTQRAADDFVRAACPPEGGLLGVHRATLSHLAVDLSARLLAERRTARLSPLGAEAVATRAVHAVRLGPALSYFEPVADTPGFGRAVARTIAELRAARVDPASLGESAPAEDLSHLLATYERELSRLRLADRVSVIASAIETVERGRHPLIGLPLLLLDVAPQSRVEAELMTAVAAASGATLATTAAGEPDCVESTRAALGVEAVEMLEEPQDGRALDRARRYLFMSDVPPAPEEEEECSFALFSAPGESRECVEIVRRIKRFAVEGVHFDRMAILLRTAESYQVLVEDALRRAGIGGFFTHGTKRPDPAGRALLALLACASEGLSASRFAEYLSLGQLPEPAADGGPPKKEVPWVPPKNDVQLVFTDLVEMTPADRPPKGYLPVPLKWEQLLVDAAVIGGRDRWVRRLDGLEAELRLHLAALSYEDEVRRQKKLFDLEALRNLKRFAIPIVEALAELPDKAVWRAWLGRLRDLAGMSLAEPEAVLRVLAELEPLGDVGPVGLDEVRDVLTERLSFLRDVPEDHRFGRVFVGTLEEAAGRTFDVVFLPGLSEGIFPKKPFEDPLLLDASRRALSEDLSLRRDRIRRERARLFSAIGAAESTLVCSFSRMDVNTGRPRVPSLFALELLRAAEGRVPSLAALEARAAEASDARLGWPAPERPEDAIDDAEYDLSILGPLVFRPPEAVRGRGRYLIEDSEGNERNAHLVRSLRAQASRWRAPFTPYDGLGRPDERVQAALADQRLSERSYSPTSLQTYAACPFRFLLHAVYRLRPREAIAALEEVDPLTRGILFHAVQFFLFSALRARNLLPVVEASLQEVFGVLDETLDRVAREYEERLAPAIPQVWHRQIETMRAELRRWLRQVAEKDADWLPIHAELAFGLDHQDVERDPDSDVAPVRILERYLVRGSVDLVEQHRSSGALRVTDHKTGKQPSKRPLFVGGGEVLQPMIYALAVEARMEAEVESGRLYYCTPRGGYDDAVIEVTPQSREHLLTVLTTIDEAVASGFLPAAPRPNACRYCDYLVACGPNEEVRITRKALEPLEPLRWLRRMP